MATAYGMHDNWREHDARRILARCKRNGGTVVPYGRFPGRLRSYVVTWPDRDECGELTGCEGNLYIVRIWRSKRESAQQPK